jgi:hypothetical protein
VVDVDVLVDFDDAVSVGEQPRTMVDVIQTRRVVVRTTGIVTPFQNPVNSSLAPLNNARSTQATLNVQGKTSLADFQLSALTCFSIHL